MSPKTITTTLLHLTHPTIHNTPCPAPFLSTKLYNAQIALLFSKIRHLDIEVFDINVVHAGCHNTVTATTITTTNSQKPTNDEKNKNGGSNTNDGNNKNPGEKLILTIEQHRVYHLFKEVFLPQIEDGRVTGLCDHTLLAIIALIDEFGAIREVGLEGGGGGGGAGEGGSKKRKRNMGMMKMMDEKEKEKKKSMGVGSEGGGGGEEGGGAKEGRERERRGLRGVAEGLGGILRSILINRHPPQSKPTTSNPRRLTASNLYDEDGDSREALLTSQNFFSTLNVNVNSYSGFNKNMINTDTTTSNKQNSGFSSSSTGNGKSINPTRNENSPSSSFPPRNSSLSESHPNRRSRPNSSRLARGV